MPQHSHHGHVPPLSDVLWFPTCTEYTVDEWHSPAPHQSQVRLLSRLSSQYREVTASTRGFVSVDTQSHVVAGVQLRAVLYRQWVYSRAHAAPQYRMRR